MSSRLNYLWLATRSGLSSTTIVKLLRHFGTPEEIRSADKQALCAVCSLTNTQIKSLTDTNMEQAEKIAYTCMKKDIHVLTIADSAYPNRLRSIPDPPIVLYIYGRWLDFDRIPGIAVVGTRRATLYGTQVAEEIGRSLAKGGLITVSGMAKGIDKAAHYGALRAGGVTVAILAGGVDVCYPPEHSRLMKDISLAGALVSEYPPGTEPRGAHYHKRNRILSGLCVATVVVEAKNSRSGSLITAHCALDQSRDVYAVPGGLNMPNSLGCNQLISEGQAILLYHVDQLVQEYGNFQTLNQPRSRPQKIPMQKKQEASPTNSISPKERDITARPWTQTSSVAPSSPPDTPSTRERDTAARPWTQTPSVPPSLPQISSNSGASANLSAEKRQIIQLIQTGIHTVDDIADQSGLSASRVMCLITMLELEGVVQREKNKYMIQ